MADRSRPYDRLADTERMPPVPEQTRPSALGWETLGVGAEPARRVPPYQPNPNLLDHGDRGRYFPPPSRRITHIRFGAIFWPVFCGIVAAATFLAGAVVGFAYLYTALIPTT
jgi:hypothetical protein